MKLVLVDDDGEVVDGIDLSVLLGEVCKEFPKDEHYTQVACAIEDVVKVTRQLVASAYSGAYK